VNLGPPLLDDGNALQELREAAAGLKAGCGIGDDGGILGQTEARANRGSGKPGLGKGGRDFCPPA
jgi:hypothetical protein